jgi:hypothetical protein
MTLEDTDVEAALLNSEQYIKQLMTQGQNTACSMLNITIA